MLWYIWVRQTLADCLVIKGGNFQQDLQNISSCHTSSTTGWLSLCCVQWECEEARLWGRRGSPVWHLWLPCIRCRHSRVTHGGRDQHIHVCMYAASFSVNQFPNGQNLIFRVFGWKMKNRVGHDPHRDAPPWCPTLVGRSRPLDHLPR